MAAVETSSASIPEFSFGSLKQIFSRTVLEQLVGEHAGTIPPRPSREVERAGDAQQVHQVLQHQQKALCQ